VTLIATLLGVICYACTISINQRTKFEVLSFTDSKDVIRG